MIPSFGPQVSALRSYLSAGRVGFFLVLFPYAEMLARPFGIDKRAILAGDTSGLAAFRDFALFGSVLAVLGTLFCFRAVASEGIRRPGNHVNRVFGGIGIALFGLNLVLPSGVLLLGSMLHSIQSPRMENDPRNAGQAAAELTGLYHHFEGYARGREDRQFPPLSAKPGQLMHDPAALPENRSPTLYIVRDDPDYAGYIDRRLNSTSLATNIDDWSFFYLGYAIQSEEELEAFVEAYRKGVAEGVDLGSALPSPRLHQNPQVLPPDARRPPLPGVQGAGVPVLIERIDHNGFRGGYVLYLNGQVAWLDYPGEWPMTERSVALLNTLDQMGGAPAEGDTP